MEMPDAPAPQPAGETSTSSSPPVKKYDSVIDPGQIAPRYSGMDKMIFSARENLRVVTIFTSLYSTGYEQLADSDPKYGSDAGAGAARFGASMLRSATVKTLSDGIFSTAFHQDPRYYRIAHGGIWSRGLRSASRALIRRSDDGNDQVNFSGIAGRAAAAVLTLAYYPAPSQTTKVVLSTFGTSIATNAGGNLVVEFLPDVARKFPFIERFMF
jgi:hypothetical protein